MMCSFWVVLLFRCAGRQRRRPRGGTEARNNRFAYRSLPNSWFKSPLIVVCRAVINNSDNGTCHRGHRARAATSDYFGVPQTPMQLLLGIICASPRGLIDPLCKRGEPSWLGKLHELPCLTTERLAAESWPHVVL